MTGIDFLLIKQFSEFFIGIRKFQFFIYYESDDVRVGKKTIVKLSNILETTAKLHVYHPTEVIYDYLSYEQ